MDDKNSINSSSGSYPKDLPWQELKAKVDVDETIFENKPINEQHAKGHDIDTGSSVNRNQSTGNVQMKEPLPLPHQQVPQPDDFSTQALEQL